MRRRNSEDSELNRRDRRLSVADGLHQAEAEEVRAPGGRNEGLVGMRNGVAVYDLESGEDGCERLQASRLAFGDVAGLRGDETRLEILF